MQPSPWRKPAVLLVLLGIAAVAQAADPVSNTLTVQRIASQSDGRENSEPASSARPGDLLEYTAEFHNAGASTARGLSATLPLPAGTEFVSASGHPGEARASIDGISFAAMPLKRLVKQPDGAVYEQLIPLREYRFLRWPATELAVGGTLRVSARVRIAMDAGL